jgi:hypothetical protein
MSKIERSPIWRDTGIDDGERPTPPAIAKRVDILTAGRTKISTDEFVSIINLSAELTHLEQEKISKGKKPKFSIPINFQLPYQPK